MNKKIIPLLLLSSSVISLTACSLFKKKTKSISYEEVSITNEECEKLILKALSLEESKLSRVTYLGESDSDLMGLKRYKDNYIYAYSSASSLMTAKQWAHFSSDYMTSKVYAQFTEGGEFSESSYDYDVNITPTDGDIPYVYLMGGLFDPYMPVAGMAYDLRIGMASYESYYYYEKPVYTATRAGNVVTLEIQNESYSSGYVFELNDDGSAHYLTWKMQGRTVTTFYLHYEARENAPQDVINIFKNL